MEEEKNNYCQFPSQFRYDPVSQDWVIIAVGRGKRPEAFKNTRQKISISQQDCVFCNQKSEDQRKLVMVNGKVHKGLDLPPGWTLVVIPNKFPAFCPTQKIEKIKIGKFYRIMTAAGFCEVIITRGHDNHIFQMEIPQVKELIDAYQFRYIALKKEKFVNYISVFHNYGPEAGASQPHPHSQIITSPFVDVDLTRSLVMAKRYRAKNKKCIYCEMNKWEMKEKSRIVFENEHFLAICPFASKTAFETIISPKKHFSRFEEITEEMKWSLAEVFRTVLGKIKNGLNDPSFNYYLHTSPADGKKHPYHHWHWTIFPRIGIQAGFEIGTKMEISAIEPEAAAEYLRDQSA